MELTNLVVNQTARNIMQQFGTDIEKARSGVYADNEENRKLHRVGQQYGGKKQEEPSKDKPKSKEEDQKGNKGAQKDERFSEDGIVGKDGGFNKQGKTYKRQVALRQKVESGKATPEEKKEFAHLHNQYLNEKDRHAYEQSKQTDPKAKEPKYKTVDERRAEYNGKKKEGKEQKEDIKKKMSEDKSVQDLVFSIDGLCFGVYNDPNGRYGKLVDSEGYDPQSRKVKDYIFATTLEVSKPYFDEIYTAVKKYGKDAVTELFDSTDLFGEYEGLSDYVVSEAVTAKKKGTETDYDGYYAAQKFFGVSGQNESEQWFIASFLKDLGFDNSDLKRSIRRTSKDVKDTIKNWKLQAESWNDDAIRVKAESLQTAYDELMPKLENMTESEYQNLNKIQRKINARKNNWK